MSSAVEPIENEQRQQLQPQQQPASPPAFLGKTSVIVALVVSTLGVGFTGIGVFLDYQEKTAPKPSEVVQQTYSCPEERQKAVDFHRAYPQIDEKYSGPIQDQCQLNEVVADAAALPPGTSDSGGGSSGGS